MIEAAVIIAAVEAAGIDPTLCPACGGGAAAFELEENCCGRPYRDGSCCGQAYPAMVVGWECEVCQGGRSPRAQPPARPIAGQREDFTDDLDEEIPF